MTQKIQPQPGIMEIALYVGGASKVEGVSDAVKLSSNENPYGAGDPAKEAYLRAVHDLHRYPSTDHADLRQAIASHHGLDPARVICGVGSDEVLQLDLPGLCRAGRRGDVHRTRFRHVPHLRPCRRRHPRRGRGD